MCCGGSVCVCVCVQLIVCVMSWFSMCCVGWVCVVLVGYVLCWLGMCCVGWVCGVLCWLGMCCVGLVWFAIWCVCCIIIHYFTTFYFRLSALLIVFLLCQHTFSIGEF